MIASGVTYTHVRFTNCELWLTHCGCYTIFPDGAFCQATFVDDEQARATAADLGYQDVWMMHLQHEIAHTLVGEAMGRPWSYVLRKWSLPDAREDAEGSDEEALVFSLQRALMTGAKDDNLARIPNYVAVAERLFVVSVALVEGLMDRFNFTSRSDRESTGN